MGLSINDSVYSCLFFFLTGLHFFHLLVGLFLCCLLFWSCSFSNSYSFSLWQDPNILLNYSLKARNWTLLVLFSVKKQKRNEEMDIYSRNNLELKN